MKSDFQKDVACKSFQGYTSNPQLCKGCNRPVTEHVDFMKRHKEKKRQEQEKAKQAVVDYEKIREKLLELALNEIDAPVKPPPEEMVDLGGGVKMPISMVEKLRDTFVPKELVPKPKQYTVNPVTTMLPKRFEPDYFPPPFEDNGEESVRYVDDDTLRRKLKKCFGG